MYHHQQRNSQQPMVRPQSMPSQGSRNQPPPQQEPSGYPGVSNNDWRDRIEFACYGKSAALQFSESETAVRDGKNEGWKTIMIEGAKSSGPKQYDWAAGKKISFQILQSELPSFIAVMLGIQPSLKLDSHGAQKNKGLEIEIQDKNVFVKLYQGDGMGIRAVPVSFHDALMIGHLALAQYCRNYRDVITSDTALAGIRMLYGRGV